MRCKYLFVFAIFFLLLLGSANALNVYTCNDLSNIRNTYNDYYLQQDIDCTGFNFPLITWFGGHLHGQGFKIYNLNINAGSESFGGLFAQTFSNTLIERVRLENVQITSTSNAVKFGALIGRAEATYVTECYAKGTLTINSANEGSNIGGLIGDSSYSTIQSSTADVYVYARGSYQNIKTGGFIGHLIGGSVTNSYSLNTLDTRGEYQGGFIGMCENANIQNSYASVSVIDSSGCGCGLGCCPDLGGFAGHNLQGTCGSSGTYWNTGKYARNDGGLANPLTDSQMKQAASFSGWDGLSPGSISGFWFIREGIDYPRLWFEYIPVLSSSSLNPNPVKKSSSLDIACNYGRLLTTGCYGASHDGVNFPFNYNNGANAYMRGTSSSTTGTKINYCKINFVASDPRCHTPSQTQIASSSVVQCVSNPDCSGATPFCNSGTCVSCTLNSHCDDFNQCTNDVCNSGTCSHAPTTGACSDVLNCISGTCSSGVCTGTSSCSSSQICDGKGNCIEQRNCTSSDDNIMKLFNSKNSKGALWSDFDFNYAICYNDIFGAIYSGANSHSCSSGNSNAIIWLNKTSNSTASLIQSPTFNIPVCFGDLSCRSINNYLSGSSGLLNGYYAFEGNANDLTGNSNNNGVLSGAVLTSGRIGQAYLFNGSNAYISMGALNNFSILGNITISAWIKTSGDPNKNVNYTIFSRTVSWTPFTGYAFSIGNKSGSQNLSFWNGNSWTNGKTDVNDNNWHHVAVVYLNNLTIKFYVDGVLDSLSTTGAKNLNAGSVSSYAGAFSTNVLSSYFNGTIDELKIWAKALSDSELSNEFNLAQQSQSGCNPDERAVLSLNSTVNASISNASDNNFLIKICCKSAGNFYWADLSQNPINSADMGDSVKLILSKSDLVGKDINYTVYKKNGGIKFSAVIPAQFSDLGYALWSPDETGIFYFTSKIISISETLNSSDKNFGNLVVSGISSNQIPSTKILNPVKDSEYKTQETISFIQNSSDSDDDLKLTWNFGDGNSVSFSNAIFNNLGNTNHSYSSSGTKTIKLTAEEMNRNQKANDYSRIYVYQQGLNIFSVIDSPNYTGIMPPGFYTVNGSKSHVDSCDLTCPSGKTCHQVLSISGGSTLYCYQVADSSKLNFTWIFDGQVFNGITDNKPFIWYFGGSTEHRINLRVKYDY
jgi:hypothetical protein